jgi:hypothetical protein
MAKKFVSLCDAAIAAVRQRRESPGYYKGVPVVGDEIEVRCTREDLWVRVRVKERDNQRKVFRVHPDEELNYEWFSFFNSRWMHPDPPRQWRWPGQDMHGKPIEFKD